MLAYVRYYKHIGGLRMRIFIARYRRSEMYTHIYTHTAQCIIYSCKCTLYNAHSMNYSNPRNIVKWVLQTAVYQIYSTFDRNGIRYFISHFNCTNERAFYCVHCAFVCNLCCMSTYTLVYIMYSAESVCIPLFRHNIRYFVNF